MEIVKNAVAGTLESSDILICVEPCERLIIEIRSVVDDQYHDAICSAIAEVLEQFQVRRGKICVNDRGALDCVIRARMETVLIRGGGKE